MGMEKVLGQRKKRKMRQKKVTIVQKLYDTCKEVFANCGHIVDPDADGIQRLQHILKEELDYVRILNGALPNDIRVIGRCPSPDNFSASLRMVEAIV